MQQPPSSDQFNGMRLSSFRQYCATHKNPFQRKKLGNHPFWTTADGKIVWLKVVRPENQTTRYELQTCTLKEYCQKPLIQRGVVQLDRYYSPRKPDTPLLKRRARVMQQIGSYSASYVPPRGRKQNLVQRMSKPHIPDKQENTDIKPVPPNSQQNQIPVPEQSRNQPRKLRLVERVSEIAYGDLDERVGLFLRRAAREIPENPEQIKNRWFGMDKSGRLVMTKSSWLSWLPFFFKNPDIKRFIKYYAPALTRRVQRHNLIRQWYNLPPIQIQAPDQERHCHAEILQKQLIALSEITNRDFQSLLKKNIRSTAQLLFYYQDSCDSLPPAIKQKVKQICQLISDWLQCAPPEEHRLVIDQYMKGISQMCHDPTVHAHCPGITAQILKAAPLLMQRQLQGDRNPTLNEID